MTAAPVVPSERAGRDAIERLSRVEPGPFQVLSCYLKLEPRDKERGKYLIKMKNRVKRVESDLARRALDHAQREATAADLARVLHYFEERPTCRRPAVSRCSPAAGSTCSKRWRCRTCTARASR